MPIAEDAVRGRDRASTLALARGADDVHRVDGVAVLVRGRGVRAHVRTVLAAVRGRHHVDIALVAGNLQGRALADASLDGLARAGAARAEDSGDQKGTPKDFKTGAGKVSKLDAPKLQNPLKSL